MRSSKSWAVEHRWTQGLTSYRATHKLVQGALTALQPNTFKNKTSYIIRLYYAFSTRFGWTWCCAGGRLLLWVTCLFLVFLPFQVILIPTKGQGPTAIICWVFLGLFILKLVINTTKLVKWTLSDYSLTIFAWMCFMWFIWLLIGCRFINMYFFRLCGLLAYGIWPYWCW